MQALLYTLAPVLAVVLGAIIASRTKLNPGLVAGLQHLAAGVVFAAAATEILPQVKHEASPRATLIGGAAGVARMLGLKSCEARFNGPKFRRGTLMERGGKVVESDVGGG